MANCHPTLRSSQVSSTIQSIQKGGGLQFCEVFPVNSVASSIMETVGAYRDRVFSPEVTLFAFMHQALSSDKSLREGIARVNADRIAAGQEPASLNTAAFSKARQELPEKLPQQLFRSLAQTTESQASEKFPAQSTWQGRCIKVVDGSTLLMPDTPENQSEFPQMKNQQKGSGFPIARIVAIFSLLTGCALDLAIGPYKGKETGEHALLRQILNCLEQGDILLGDAYYSSYFLMVMLLNMGVDFVFESHGSRQVDFRIGRRLGNGDHLLSLKKPKKPDWMSEECYASMPETLEIREVQIMIETPGFRTKKNRYHNLFCEFETA